MGVLSIFATGALGAGGQELLWWYNARYKLRDAEYASLLRSPGYWMITLAFVLAGGGFTVAWLQGGAEPTLRTALLTGAAMPLLIKQGLKPLTPQQHLGASKSFSVWDYLK